MSYWSESETQTRHNVLRSEVTSGCQSGPRITKASAKRELVRTLGDMIATALELPLAAGSASSGVRGLMSPEVAVEYAAISARFYHQSAEFPLGCSDGIAEAGPAWMTDGEDSTKTWPCLRGRAKGFVSAFSELADGATTAVASERGLMRALVGSYLETVAEAVLPAKDTCRFFAESSAAMQAAHGLDAAGR
jgi:hypothetical protein